MLGASGFSKNHLTLDSWCHPAAAEKARSAIAALAINSSKLATSRALWKRSAVYSAQRTE
jgi:hypothetical protein